MCRFANLLGKSNQEKTTWDKKAYQKKLFTNLKSMRTSLL